jgi:hypothetical protein
MKAVPPEIAEAWGSILESLIERKLALFADNQRYIIRFDLHKRASGPYLQVESTLPIW